MGNAVLGTKTCLFCGRRGVHAYREAIDARTRTAGWACSHTDTCQRRIADAYRAGSRLSERGDGALEPIDPGAVIGLIGSSGPRVARLHDLLALHTGTDAVTLDASRRSLDRLGRALWDLVVVDTTANDSVAFRNDLVRRLSGGRRRTAVIMIGGPGVERQQPLAQLAARPTTIVLRRPCSVEAFLGAVDRTFGRRVVPKDPHVGVHAVAR